MNPSKSTALESLAPMIGTESARDQQMLDVVQRTTPQKLDVNLGDYNKLLNDYAYLNDFQNKKAEMDLAPNVAEARQLQDRDMLDTYKSALSGNLPAGVQNALLSAGLENHAATGTATGAGTRGNATLTELYGRGTNDYINSVKDLVGRYINNTPKPMAGLDPSSAANLKLGTDTANNQTENDFRQNLVNATIGANNNRSNRSSAFGGAAAQQAVSNAGASNSMRAAYLQALASIAGGAASGYAGGMARR